MQSILQIKLKAINKESLFLYKTFLLNVLTKLNIQYNITSLPSTVKRITLLKSPHVHKKAREQFEILTQKALINVKSNIEPQMLKFLLINKPKTVKLKITKI